MAVSLPIPEVIPQLYVVLFDGELPGEEVITEAIDAWMESRVQGRLRRIVPRFLDGFVRIEPTPLEEVPLPPLGMLRYLGLGEAEESVLQRATRAIVVSGADIPLPPRAGYWATRVAAGAVAHLVEGVVLDPDQRRVRPIAEQQDSRLRTASWCAASI